MCTLITQKSQGSARDPSWRWWVVLTFSIRSDCFTTRLQPSPWWEVMGLWQSCQSPFKHLAALEIFLEVEWNWCNATMASVSCKAGKHNQSVPQEMVSWKPVNKGWDPKQVRVMTGCRRSCNLWDLIYWFISLIHCFTFLAILSLNNAWKAACHSCNNCRVPSMKFHTYLQGR